eukprot:CAMPEP_0183705310 /NCGR_PEP_ID=MMETSP0737-20130205/2455_1 /TAXON_ID=385413 /ORGANISM="Thalassiosira miniscula, Strain CCMP1093" /LENGTH=748 /DNA_ID=CAMNT_0025932447 /DNA_START=49 /DNA_END=2293 /DNA_ORIENTATION=-
MASIASSALTRSRSPYSLPNWTRLTSDDDAEDRQHSDGDAAGAGAAAASAGAADEENAVVEDDISHDLAPDVNGSASNALEPTYSTPHEASVAYQSGLLKSDFNISSNHRSIRLAFRYLPSQEEEDTNKDASMSNAQHEGSEEERDENTDDEDLFLCWVRQDGTPRHFRRMRPIRNNSTQVVSTTGNESGADDIGGDDAEMGEEETHGNLRGSFTNNEPREQTISSSVNDTLNTLLVNENDQIEKTFPGHAFVFCRRVPYEQSERSTDDNNDESRNGDDLIVVNENGTTCFLRKRIYDDEEEDNENEEEWEKYLVVGGFRPGPMPEMEGDGSDSESASNANDAEASASGSDNEEGKTEESDDESNGDDDSSDDDSFDEGELVQLVTIQQMKYSTMSNGAPSALNTKSEETDEDELPPRVVGCPDCVKSVPFLRGAINPKPSHADAFVDSPMKNPPALENNNEEGQTTATGEERNPLLITVCMTQLDPTPLDTSSKHYDEVILGGWPCRIEPGCFPSDMDVPATGRNSLRCRFEADLIAASESLPLEAREKLRASTPIWINKSQSFGPKVAPIKGRDGCFHPGAKWLKRNGMNPAKCGGVEWYEARHYLEDCDMWGPGGLMLHELSHAWHCLHIEDGYDNEEIIDVYNRAMDDGLYDCVPVHGPQGPRCKAYACQDQMEYFAELSVAFLGGLDDREHNKWYPFNRAQLRDHDPRAFAMLCRMWGVEDESMAEDLTPGQRGSGEDWEKVD